jgi:hypothetical protein
MSEYKIENNNLINKNEFHKYIKINGLRNPKAIQYKDKLILIGSKLYDEEENKKKYLLYSYLLDNEFNLINDTENILNLENIIQEYKININISCWIRDIYYKIDDYYLLVEFKQNNNDKYFTSKHYYLKTNDFNDFEIFKEYDIQDFFFKDYNNNLFISKIENTNHIWGKYLFEFVINNKKIIPIFDKIVNYQTDFGHAFHHINYNKLTNIFYIIFSIRHLKKNEENIFYYKIYEAESFDLIYYFNTNELELNIDNIDTEWICYPWKFQFNNKDYILCNQDDFGKEKYPIIF